MKELDYQLKVQKEVADELNIKRLQKQLKEANKVLAGMITPQTPSIEPVIKYLEKWEEFKHSLNHKE